MSVNVGIVGLGFMGKMHFDTYAKLKHARVVAICDEDPKKRAGDWSSILGNIGGQGRKVNLSRLHVYAKLGDMLADPAVQVVDVTLPTAFHAKAAIAALGAGKHVICEKPIAIDAGEATRMVKAAKRARRRLFVAHCIRFWPSYVVARDAVRSGRYGRVLTATFRRFSTTPTWSWHNWLQDPKTSGACALDLHIHDADFLLYLFGKPKAVTSHGGGLRRGRIDHIVTSYDYGDGRLITAEGAWEYAAGYPFSMSFTIAMEKATLVMTPDLRLHLYRLKGKPTELPVPQGDGYSAELKHFIDCLRRSQPSPVVSPESALASVKLIEDEVRSARFGRPVRVRG